VREVLRGGPSTRERPSSIPTSPRRRPGPITPGRSSCEGRRPSGPIERFRGMGPGLRRGDIECVPQSPHYTSTHEDTPPHSRGAIAPGSCDRQRPQKHRGRREDRVPARPPRLPRKKGLRERAAATGVGGITPAFPAQWLYGVLRALPGEPALATVARARPLESCASLTRAWARQNHTASSARGKCRSSSALPRPPHSTQRP